MTHCWRLGVLAAAVAMVTGANAGCSPGANELRGAGHSSLDGEREEAVVRRGRIGTKQGPLLMGDDFEAALKQFCRSGNGAGGEAVAKELSAIPEPADSVWSWPKPPAKADSEADTLVERMFPRGCRTAGAGTGPVRAGVFRGNRGRFDVLCAAGSGQYSYTVSSPCVRYKAARDGWVRFDMAVVIAGRSVIRSDGAGEGRVEIGVYAAHCWPKEKGKYWQEGRLVQDKPGEQRHDGRLMRLKGAFPVEAGQQYSFGFGLTTQAAARNGAAAGVRLWGRLAWVRIYPAESVPGNIPYRARG